MNPNPLRWRESAVARLAHALAGAPHEEWQFAHAQDVEKHVKRLLQEPACSSLAEEERLGLQVAALFHDIGQIQASSERTSGKEKLRPEALTAILGQMEEFKDSTRLLKLVEDLVSDCEAAFPGFPTAIREKSSTKSRTTNPDARTRELIDFLREADALAHLEDSYLEESIESWLNAGLRRVQNRSGCIATWMWNDSVVGNLRLTAKRGLLDTRTPSGHAKAVAAYHRVEELVRTQCELAEEPYEPEVCAPEMLEHSRKEMSRTSFSLEIVRFHPWDELEALVRQVPLLYDRKIRPYEHANLAASLLEIENLAPLSNYVMKDRLEEVEELHHAFMVTFCFSLWDLPGLVRFRYNNKCEQVLAPPVVEIHEKQIARKDTKRFARGQLDHVLIDGLHRAEGAVKNSLHQLRAVVISAVDLPPMAISRDWARTPVYEYPPRDEDKRKYRYESLSEFNKEPFAHLLGATERTYKDCLYRDLSAIGSEGRRTFEEYKERRAHRRKNPERA